MAEKKYNEKIINCLRDYNISQMLKIKEKLKTLKGEHAVIEKETLKKTKED